MAPDEKEGEERDCQTNSQDWVDLSHLIQLPTWVGPGNNFALDIFIKPSPSYLGPHSMFLINEIAFYKLIMHGV